MPDPGEASANTVKRLQAGRSLAEFQPLLAAETQLLQACANGANAEISGDRPDDQSKETHIRSEFLRFLLLGGDNDAPVHEMGIQLNGATIIGVLNLSNCKIEYMMIFKNCVFINNILLLISKSKSIIFINSSINEFHANLLSVEGSLVFRHGSICRGHFNLQSCSITGNLAFTNSTLYSPAGNSLSCEGAQIGGGVFLDAGFRSFGSIRFHSARIQAAFSCQDGAFLARGGRPLVLDGAFVGGTLSLADGFRAIGEVRIMRTRVDGDLDCENSIFKNSGGIALHARSVSIKGGLLWRHVKALNGIVSFDSAKAQDLVDDWGSWEKADHLILDGFRYDRISGGESPTDAATRMKWLHHQKPEAFRSKFWPQPWEHLVKVLREMGHVEDARRVAIGKQHALRNAGLIGQRPVAEIVRWRRWRNVALNGIHRAFHWTYGVLAGFGYRPLKTVGWMVLVWLACGFVYMSGASNGLIGPTNPSIYTNASFDQCGDAGQPAKEFWTQCRAMPSEYTPFDPFVYSLDVILPLLDLKQETEWRPAVHAVGGDELVLGHVLRFLMWFEILFGWITSLLLVSVLGKLVQKD